MDENKRKQQRQKGKRGAENAAEHHSCGEQADSAQQSKHTAGLPWEEANGGGATSLSLLVPPTMPASLPADSCTPVIYFSPPHLTGRLLPITQGRGSALTARHPARALASRCDTLCCWTLPTGAPFPDWPGTSTFISGDQLGSVWVFNYQSCSYLLWSYLQKVFKKWCLIMLSCYNATSVKLQSYPPSNNYIPQLLPGFIFHSSPRHDCSLVIMNTRGKLRL